MYIPISNTLLYASVSCADSVCNSVCEHSWPCIYFLIYFLGSGGGGVVLPLESPGWRGIWLEWMLPGEYGLVSRQHPLKDTLPNAVGLENKGSPPLPGKYACYVPQPISTPHLSLPAFSLPFCFHTSSSFLPLSLTIFSYVSLSTLCRQAVMRSMPFHIYLPLHLLFLSVSLSLIVFLLSISPSHRSHFFFCLSLI